MKKTKNLITLMLVFALLFSITGCSNSSDNNANNSDNSGNTEQNQGNNIETNKGWYSEHYDESMKGTTLNMYAVTDNVLPVLDAFYEDTGIKIESLTMKNGEMLQRIINEKDSGNVLADLWFTGGADTFISAAEQGLLMPYKSTESDTIEADMKDEDGYWTGTSLTVVNLVVNTDVIKDLGAKIPETWEDLLQPELKGMVSMPDPASSGTAYNTVSAILQTKGEEEGWAYLEKLIEQVPFFTPRGSDPTNMTQTGEAAVGIAAGTGFAEMKDAAENIKLVYPKDGTGWWPQPLAILEGCSHSEEAKVFVDWALSARGLEEIGKAQNALLVKDGVPTVEGIMQLKEINLFPTDFKANAKDRDSILEQWSVKAKK